MILLMKWLLSISLLLLFALPACDVQRREKLLEEKEVALTQKERDLLLREQAVQLKEEELAKRQEELDSAHKAVDTLSVLHPSLPGTWNVTMRCTETTCPGSAVGDTKTEQWQLSFQNNTIVAKAMSDKQLSRIYSGSYAGNSFELTALQADSVTQTTKMIVRLQPTKENEMTGQREIIRTNDCRIVYALELKKQQ
jgi:hypothetical protein